MEQITSILGKIEKIAGNTAYSAIEKDLMLRYTRDLYEAILSVESGREEKLPVSPQLTEEPELQPAAVIKEQEESVTEDTAEEEEEQTKQEEEQAQEDETIADESEQGSIETSEPSREDRVEVPYNEDTPDHSDIYSDIPVQAEENAPAPKISFELEPELREDPPTPFQPKNSNDFKIWNKDIRSYIGINDKYNFISELFSGNSEAYEEILTEVNQCDNKQDALRFLENAGITTLYKWKEDGFSEQIFYNVLNQFFTAR